VRGRVEARQQGGEAAERSTRAADVGDKVERRRDGGAALQRGTAFVRWVGEQHWSVGECGLQPGCELRGASCHDRGVWVHEDEEVNTVRVQ
jgi:hypothetical protein